jgi:hypothetical protein
MTAKIKIKKEARNPIKPTTGEFVSSVRGILKSKDGQATEALLKEHKEELAKGK